MAAGNPGADAGASRTYFVTGATGFIGRRLVERLLARDGDIYVLVRAGSIERLEGLRDRWAQTQPSAADRIKLIVGDLDQSRLGVSEVDVAALLEAGVDHVFHVAAVYDMTADEERNRIANVEGTRNAIGLANALRAGRFHHVSRPPRACARRSWPTSGFPRRCWAISH